MADGCHFETRYVAISEIPVVESKFKSFYDQKPNQIPPLGIRIEPDLQAVGYKKQYTLQYSLPADPPWLLKRPHINFSLHSSPEIFLNKFYEICDEYKGFCRLYTDGSLVENRVACAVVSRTFSESVRLPNNTSIFRAELHAITLATRLIRKKRKRIF